MGKKGSGRRGQEKEKTRQREAQNIRGRKGSRGHKQMWGIQEKEAKKEKRGGKGKNEAAKLQVDVRGETGKGDGPDRPTRTLLGNEVIVGTHQSQQAHVGG